MEKKKRIVKAGQTIDTLIVSSMCDERSYMSIPAIMDAFQDVAGIHAASAGAGVFDLEKLGLFWIVSKMRLVINRRPFAGEKLKLSTWIVPGEKIVCERDCSISEGDETLAYCRCIWAALRRDNGRPEPMDNFYPYPDEILDTADDRPYTRISKKFEGAEEIGSYTIRSVDIDRGGHMNNVNYVRAMLGCFTCEEIQEMDIKEIDMHFLLQCYEGETISFVKRAIDDKKMEIGAFNEDKKLVFAACLYTANVV